MGIAQFLKNRSKPFLAISGFVLIVLVGFADYRTGAEISFSIFYLVPIIFLSWFLGREAGFLGSLASAIAWLVADLLTNKAYTNSIVSYWNASVRLGIFLIVSHILVLRKRAEVSLQQSNENLENLVGELTMLGELGNLLRSCLDSEEVYAVLSRSAQRIFPGSSGAVYLVSSSRDIMETVSSWGPSPGQHHTSLDGCWALRKGRLHWVDDTRTGILCSHRTTPLALNSLCLPMIAQGETLGVFHLQGENLLESVRRIGVALAEQTALALSNLRLRENLRNQAIRDPLTGLFNRRYLEEFLAREIKRAQRSQLPIGIIMIDIDHFKPFNDLFGHLAGDAFLQAFGKCLLANIRGGDVACRYGGEEFLLMLPETSFEETGLRAEQIRIAAKELRVQHMQHLLGPVTLSVGVAAFPLHGSTIEGLVQSADSALYRAKEEGRDRVLAAERL